MAFRTRPERKCAIFSILRLSNRNASIALGALSLLFLVSTTYTAVNGTHTWRQSDAFAQILGFLGYKGMVPLQLFTQGTAFFDTPIYEWLSAMLSKATNTDPLVAARLVNDACWALFLMSGYRVAETIVARSGLLFMLLACTSPLFLQYFAAPIPDGMSLALGMGATALLLGDLRARNVAAACCLIAVSALIKSPIAYVVLVFLAVRVVSQHFFGRQRLTRRRVVSLSLPFSIALAATLCAELLGKTVNARSSAGEAESLNWYFGSISLRFAGYFWQFMLDRFTASFASPILVAVVVIAAVVLFACDPREFSTTIAPTLAAFFAGWLTFSNVFILHDYYEMAVVAVVMIGGASGLHRLGERIVVAFSHRARANQASVASPHSEAASEIRAPTVPAMVS